MSKCLKCSYIQSESGKIRTRKTPNTENFHAVVSLHFPQVARKMESLYHATRTNKNRTNKNRTNKSRTNKNKTNKNRLPRKPIKTGFALTFSYLKTSYPYRLPYLLTHLIELDSQHET